MYLRTHDGNVHWWRMDLRELKALEIAARAKLVYHDGAWIVPSQSSNSKYRVLLGSEPSCTCEDFELRRQPCKHIVAAQLVEERDGRGKARVLDTNKVPKKPTYKQNWETYNRAKIEEKSRLRELLRELCKNVAEPYRNPSRTGQKPIPMGERAFAAVMKVYSGMSCRRFGTDLKEDYERGLLSRRIHPNTINTFLEDPLMTMVLQDLIARSSRPLIAVEEAFAADSTGFSVARRIRWQEEKYGQRSGRDYVKAHILCGVNTNVIAAATIQHRDASDHAQFKSLVQAAMANGFQIREVSGDKAYLSHEHLDFIDGLGGIAFIPFKCNSLEGDVGSVWNRMFHMYSLRRDEFLAHYHRRSNVESTFSMVKRVFGDHVRSKTDIAMKNEAFAKFVCHNLACVIMSQLELGIVPEFWNEAASEGATILPMNGA
jgi:transposase